MKFVKVHEKFIELALAVHKKFARSFKKCVESLSEVS
jgi:hypothetical protein